MIGYKLTTQELTTHNGFQWEVGKKAITKGNGELCTDAYLHFYDDPLLAVIFNPIHADIKNPELFEVEIGGEIKEEKGRKFGCTEMTLLKEIPLPEITLVQKIAFAILCAKEVYKEEKWNKWADNWLSGEDRSKGAAADTAVAAAAYAAAAVAAYAAVDTAADTAAVVAYAAADTAAAVATAADAAADTAADTAAATDLNFKKIIKQAMKY